MKKLLKTILSFAMVLGCVSLSPVSNTYASEQYEKTFPYVQSYETNQKTMTLGQESRILVIENTLSLNDDKVITNVELISSQLGTILTKSPNIVFGNESQILPNDIVIELKDIEELKDKEDSYKIEITDYIKITSKDNAGIFYGVQSLIQLLKVNDFTLPQGTIIDYPETKERALHLDLARKYFTIDWVKDLIEDMAYLKMDSLQIHFSEHEAYRLESEVLNNVSGFRYPSNYYTKEQMADIVNYAKMHHIDVVPSLDSPGHMRYVLGFLPANYKLSTVSNVSGDGAATGAFNIFNEDARNFLKSLFREYAEFFSELGCTKMNIGGDEFLNNFSLLTGEQYAELMGYFNEIAALIGEYGMTARAWNDGVMFSTYDKSTYTFDSSIEICYWAGVNNAATIEDFVNNGNKVLNYSDVFMYYVLSSWWDANANPNAERIYNNWYSGYYADARTNNVLIQQKYKEPYPDYLLGSSFAIWCDSEHYRTEDQMRTAIKDRMRAMATKAWNTTEDMPTYATMQAAFDKAGRAPAYQATLPEPGEIYRSDDSSAVVLKYVDTDGNSISTDKIVYGVTGDAYALEHKMIYGYKFVSSDKPLNGTFDGQVTITLTYELGTDKTLLEKLVNNKLSKDDYILKTYKDYHEAYLLAKEVYNNAKATQNEVDEAVEAVETAKEILVLKSYEQLFNIIESAIKEKGSYTEASFNTYKLEVNNAKALLTSNNLTQQQIDSAVNKINTARDNLKLDSFVKTTTNIEQYDINGISNAFDGNISTKFWGNGAQEVGKYIMIEFREPVMLETLEIYSGYDSSTMTNADSIKGADILVSTDGTTWNKIGAIDGDNHEVVQFDAVETKYLKISITKSSGNWPQLNEVKMTYTKIDLDKTELLEEAEALEESLYTKESFAYVTKAVETLSNLQTNDYEANAIAFYSVRVAIDSLVEVTTDDITEPEPEKPLPFTDVNEIQWYHSWVKEAYNLGLMTGATETLFKPNANMNRGMVAIVFHRMEGSKKVEYSKVFPDVANNQYYTTSVLWAKQAGVINGYTDGTFKPLRNVSREEMATMIYNFAKYKGLNVKSNKDITYFNDYAKITPYARVTIAWAVENGLISGKDNGVRLDPLGHATRAECCKMLVQAYKVIYK